MCSTFSVKCASCVIGYKLVRSCMTILVIKMIISYFYTPAPRRGRVVYCFTSVRPKIFFVTFFSATIDGRNLIFGHKLYIGMPYCVKRFWTRQIPTSCLPI